MPNRNTKEKLIKTHAAIWFNKTCRTRHICPKYIHIQVNGNNARTSNTKQHAVKHRLNLEIKFLYKNKQQLNKQLYRLHLENAQYWQENWYIIQNYIENDLKTTAEKLYKHLHSKLDRLRTTDKPHKKKKKTRHQHGRQQETASIQNLPIPQQNRQPRGY